MLLFLRNIVQLILAPSRGWEDISACGTDVATLQRKGMYPFIIVAALSVFVKLIYDPSLSIPVLVVMALVVLVSFFGCYFLSVVSFKSMFYRYCGHEPSEIKYSTVILYTISLLCLTEVICNAMPVKLGLEYLLPMAVGMILWKSNVYLSVEEDKDLGFIFFAFVTVILPPLLIQSFFARLL